MREYDTKILNESRDWKARGDNFHWDHSDGSFVELDGTQYILYSKDCARLASVRTFAGAVLAHRL